MGYSVSFTGVDIDNILSKSQKFKSQNEDWVLIPSTITTLDISTLIRNGNYAFHGTLNLPEMDQLYGYNTTSKQEAKSLEGSCLIFVRNINRTIYQFISFYGIQDVTDQTIGIAWIHKVPKVFYLNESSNILFSYAENELNDKGIAKFDRQIRLFNDTGEFKYYDESEKSYKILTGIISEMPKTIYGDLTDAFTKIDESLSTYSYVLDHINDDMIHVTSEEKEIYNSKYNNNLLNNEFDSIFPTLDTLQSNVSNLITENETVINSAVSASTPISKDLNMHTPGWNLIESIPGVIWYSVCYGNDKFVAVANSNYFAYSTDGINWTEGTISGTSRRWSSVCYGNDKFVTVGNDTNYFAYSTDGINWTEGTISSTSRQWISVCYGNDKFVAVARNSSKYFVYSTDGITWTESTISNTSRDWYSVCYGNGKFVTVADTSNYFAYSTDGINWTEGTISSTSRWWNSVCYGNNKFVAVALNSNYFAYSTDGINWTEGTINSTSRWWRSVCYGNGKFVAVADDSYFAYSTDGINWTEGTISNTNSTWTSVCYSNDKFVAVAYGNYFAYAYDYLKYIKVRKIGLQKKDDDTLTNYTDTMTGTNPQLDCIILTTDNKIYKTTFNNNSTYLKFDGSYYTTTNSAEPLGATMLEIKLPNDETAENYFNSRFASDYATMEENPNYSTSGCGICVTVNNTIQTINIDDPKCTIEYRWY